MTFMDFDIPMVDNNVAEEIERLTKSILNLVEYLRDHVDSSEKYDSLRDTYHIVNGQHTELLLSNFFKENSISVYRAKEYLSNILRAINMIISTHGENNYVYIRDKAESILVMLELSED